MEIDACNLKAWRILMEIDEYNLKLKELCDFHAGCMGDMGNVELSKKFSIIKANINPIIEKLIDSKDEVDVIARSALVEAVIRILVTPIIRNGEYNENNKS